MFLKSLMFMRILNYCECLKTCHHHFDFPSLLRSHFTAVSTAAELDRPPIVFEYKKQKVVFDSLQSMQLKILNQYPPRNMNNC